MASSSACDRRGQMTRKGVEHPWWATSTWDISQSFTCRFSVCCAYHQSLSCSLCVDSGMFSWAYCNKSALANIMQVCVCVEMVIILFLGTLWHFKSVHKIHERTSWYKGRGPNTLFAKSACKREQNRRQAKGVLPLFSAFSVLIRSGIPQERGQSKKKRKKAQKWASRSPALELTAVVVYQNVTHKQYYKKEVDSRIESEVKHVNDVRDLWKKRVPCRQLLITALWPHHLDRTTIWQQMQPVNHQKVLTCQ